MATALNPYAGYLGDSTPNDVIAETPKRISQLIEQIGPDGLGRSYAPGKWTAREIVCHLADVEIAFAFRLRQTLAERHHVVQTFDQDAWAKNYGSITAVEAANTFAALRHWNILLIKAAGTEALAKPLRHPERGAMTFETLVQIMAGHDRNHLAQLETIAQESAS